MNNPLQMEAQYDAANREAARIIKADPARYGEMVRWAEMVLAKPPLTTEPLPQRTQYKRDQGLLFPTNCRRR